RIGADVRLADVVTPDDENVRLPRSLFCHWALLRIGSCCHPSPGRRTQPLVTSCPGAWHAVVTLCPATLPLFAMLVNVQMTIGKGDPRRSRPLSLSLQPSCQCPSLIPREPVHGRCQCVSCAPRGAQSRQRTDTDGGRSHRRRLRD